MRSFILLNSASLALAGTILWDGRFNNVASVADLAAWSWENQVGPYQCYIHGSSPLDSYLHLDAANKNPADTESIRGAKITLDDTSYWNNQTMRRTEFIPQTTAAINTGLVYYHFSMGRSSINTPSDEHEHQIAFFESHFTEMKSGWQSGSPGDSDSSLRWVVAGSTEWEVTWEINVWYNFAYAIDFTVGSVQLYFSTGGDDLAALGYPISVEAVSDGKDWHVGMLELPRDGYGHAFVDEDIYFSGVYIETGNITLSVCGPTM